MTRHLTDYQEEKLSGQLPWKEPESYDSATRAGLRFLLRRNIIKDSGRSNIFVGIVVSVKVLIIEDNRYKYSTYI